MFYDIPFIKIEKQPIQNYKKNKNTLTIHNIFTFRNPKMEYKKERERKKSGLHFIQFLSSKRLPRRHYT